MSSLTVPNNFQCPVCGIYLNEKDFDRHVHLWLQKCIASGPIKSGSCPGIRDRDHPLLQFFPNGSLQDSVQLLVSDIRALVRPGAYDAMSGPGSGRHLDVARRLEELQRPCASICDG